MYRIVAGLFARRTACSCINNYGFKALRNFSEHNLQFSSGKFKNLNNLNNSFSAPRYVGLSKNGIRSNDDINRSLAVLAAAYKEQGRIYVSNIINVLENLNSELLKDNHDILLLQCCGHAIVDQALQPRAELYEQVWKKLEECGVIFNTEHYNVYLKNCIENRVQLDFANFLSQIKCDPNEETYRLLLDCACEVGDVDQAVKIVALMKKKNIRADERLFDAMVLGHAIRGGLADAEEVLQTMQTAHVAVSRATCNAIIRGLALHNNHQEFLQAVRMFPDVIQEPEMLKLLMALGLNGNYTWLKEILEIVGPVKMSKQGLQQLELICIHLIYSGQPESSIMFYKTFIEPFTVEDQGMYAFLLLVEMIRCKTPAKIIINIATSLRESGLNLVALEKITGVALRKGHTETAWELLEAMPNLRPHYFWPLLLKAEQGETGILSTLKKMLSWNVRPDLETFEFYCIPLCDSTDPKQLLARLQTLGFTVRELLTPLLSFLLKEDRIGHAQQLSSAHENVLINSERMVNPLVKAWCSTGDAKNAVRILQKMCRTAVVPGDYMGQFLLRTLKACRTPASHEQFLELLKIIRAKKLHISITVSDSLMYWLKLPSHECAVNAEIRETVDTLVNASVNQNYSPIPHPRDMSLVDLEHHLVELMNKNMETRGVLRRLIQEHSRVGNESRVNELRQQFIDAGYNETAGMKSALLYTYIINNNESGAVNIYREIKKSYPTFVLDDFKVLDLATLLVTNNKFESAVKVLIAETEKRKARGGPTIMRNCLHLIGATSDETQAEKLFNVLVDRGYCVPTNIILGPLVKIHINKADLNKAVKVYSEIAEKYKCTPLQMELLCAVVKDENEQLLQEVLNVVSKIHGSEAATGSLISALAQCGLHKSLRKFLLEKADLPKKEIEKRCERWVTENRLFALETLAQAVYRLPSDIFDRFLVYHYIMRLHSVNNNCESAVAFYRQLLEKEEAVPSKIVDELLRLVNRCKYEMPEIVTTKGVG